MTPASDARSRDQMLIEAGLTLSAELDLDAVLQRIVELACDITGARYGALGVLGEDRRIERFITIGISDEERAALGDPPTGHGILGVLIELERPLRLPDLTKDPRSIGFPPNHPPMRSLLGAPVRALGRVFGNIYLTDTQNGDEFTDDDEAALVVLATQAGVAIENARLWNNVEQAQHQLRRLEVLDDRERIATELHDGVVQSLFAVGMALQGAAALADDPAIGTRLENAVEDIDRVIRDLRNYIFGLRPGILADRHLDEAIRELATETTERTGVLAVVDVDETVAAELASRAGDVIQLVRETLSNVGKHAEATTVSVRLRRTPDGGAELEIDDDGHGFDVGAPHDGMGLANLGRRVEAMGGALTITSDRTTGTTVTARWPA
jgi:signal transduction histidine kinase